MRERRQRILGPGALLCALALAHVATAPAAAQGSGAGSLPRDVLVEHHLELLDSARPELNLRVRIPLERLVFRREEGVFRATTRIAAKARRKEDGRLESTIVHGRVERPDFASSRAVDEFHDQRFVLSLTPGRWEVEILVYARGDSAPWRRRIKLVVPAMDESGVFLQGPRWLGGQGGGSLSPPFVFRDPWELGETAARFADGLDGEVLLETDVLRAGDGGEPVPLALSLLDRGGTVVHYARQTAPPGAARRVLAWRVPVGKLSMGAYLLEVEAAAPGGPQRVRGRLDVGLTAAAFGRDWEETRDLIRHLAEPDELDAFDRAADDERAELWRRFWRRRDANGDGPGNPAEESFWRRFSLANERFSDGFRHGYRSDRGRVFIEHGEPDRVERYQDDRNFRVLEYWHYTRLGLVYVFESRYGADSFSLIQVGG